MYYVLSFYGKNRASPEIPNPNIQYYHLTFSSRMAVTLFHDRSSRYGFIIWRYSGQETSQSLEPQGSATSLPRKVSYTS